MTSSSLEARPSCVEQKDRQEVLFFNLGCTGREANCCRGKLSAGKQRAARPQKASACWPSAASSGGEGLSDSSSNSGAGVEARQPEITLQAPILGRRMKRQV